MIDENKYISDPYSLDELIQGNDFFKINYHFFYKLSSITMKILEKDKVENAFNEFLIITSLFINETDNYPEIIELSKDKLTRTDYLSYLLVRLPYILEDIFIINSDIPVEVETAFIRFIENIEIKKKEVVVDKSEFDSVIEDYNIQINHWLKTGDIKDLHNFFDLAKINQIAIIENELKSKLKRKLKIKQEVELTAPQKIHLIEAIIYEGKWGDYSDRAKATIIQYLIGSSHRNITKTLAETDKTTPETSIRYKKDKEMILNLLSNLR